jgi:hypothetical protein
VEQSIFVFLLWQGYTPAEVVTLCRDNYRLPRFLEDLDRGNDRRITQSLTSAVKHVEGEKERRRGADPLRPHRRRRRFLQLCSRGLRTTDLVAAAISELDIEERQAYNLLRRHRAAGYISTSNELTPAGRKALARKSRLFLLPQ